MGYITIHFSFSPHHRPTSFTSYYSPSMNMSFKYHMFPHIITFFFFFDYRSLCSTSPSLPPSLLRLLFYHVCLTPITGDLTLVRTYPVTFNVPHKVIPSLLPYIYISSPFCIYFVSSSPLLTILLPSQLVYTIHDYPREVSNVPTDAGAAKVSMLQKTAGFVVNENIAPLWVGECGTNMQTAGMDLLFPPLSSSCLSVLLLIIFLHYRCSGMGIDICIMDERRTGS